MSSFVLRNRLINRGLLRFKEYSTLCNVHPSTSVILSKPRSFQFRFCEQISKNNVKGFNYNVVQLQYYCKSTKLEEDKSPKPGKPSIFQRFKQMYRDYWYVLVPVHIVTSAAWFGGFYYLAKSGVDIVALLEAWNMNERILNTMRDSSMGYIAVSYALYKIATPARYAVTLGGTTLSINYLKKWGYIKPVPSKDELLELYQEKRDNLLERAKETKEVYQEQKDNLMDSVRKTKDNLQSLHKKSILKEEKRPKK